MAKPIKVGRGFRESNAAVQVKLQRRGPKKMHVAFSIDSDEFDLDANFNWKAPKEMVDGMYSKGQELLEEIGEDHDGTLDGAKGLLTLFLRGFADRVDAVDQSLEEE